MNIVDKIGLTLCLIGVVTFVLSKIYDEEMPRVSYYCLWVTVFCAILSFFFAVWKAIQFIWILN